MKNRITILNREYKIDKTKGTIVCILTCAPNFKNIDDSWSFGWGDFHPWTKKFPTYFTKKSRKFGWCAFTVIGKAKCNEVDTFNEITGRRIAESKARLKAYKVGEYIWECFQNMFEDYLYACIKTKEACKEEFNNELYHLNTLSNDN